MPEIKPLKVLEDKYPELAEWIKSICRYQELDKFLVIDYKKHKDGKRAAILINLYTKSYRYRISARKPGHEDKGYLGCTVTSRKSIAGEEWFRGNDLPDGLYNEKTWIKIKDSILAYELVKVAKHKSRSSYIGDDGIPHPNSDSSEEQKSTLN